MYLGENNLHQVRPPDSISVLQHTGLLLQAGDGDILSWSATTKDLNITAKANDNVVMFYTQ